MVKTFKYIIQFLLHGNLTPAEESEIQSRLVQSNKNTLQMVSIIGIIVYSFATFMAIFTRSANMQNNCPAYVSCGMACILIFLITMYAGEKKPLLIQILVYLQYLTFLGFGIYLSIITSPNMPSMSLIVMFVIVPILFAQKPYKILLLSTIVNVVFQILCLRYKPVDLQFIEFGNGTIYSFFGILIGMLISKYKMKRILFELQLTKFTSNNQLAHNIQSIADIYVSMHLVNLANDTFIKIQSNEIIDSSLSNFNEGFHKQVELAMKATTKPEYLSNVLHFVNPKTLPERLKGKRSITYEFQGIHLGWCRARFIAVGPIGPEIEPNEVIYAVENIDEQKKLESTLITKAETDAMTGLLNRQAGIEKIKDVIKSKKNGMLALFDVDKFKHINDTFGHQIGDDVIVAVAHAMQDTFRGEDILLRLGGDEYVIFVNGVTSEERGTMIINRFFKVIENISFEKVENLKINVSLGAILINGNDNITFEEYYHRVDECTYKSKESQGSTLTFWK